MSQSEQQEGVFGSENLTSAYLEPVTSEEEIDYSLVYALFTFVASMEGQISVLRGEPLELLDDSNSYWWAVKCLSTGDIGYIPAENIETPYEKLARFNRHRNVQLTTVSSEDAVRKRKEKTTKIAFAEYHTEIYTDGYPYRNSGESELGVPQEEEVEEKKSTEKKSTGFLGRFFKPKKEKEDSENSRPSIQRQNTGPRSDSAQNSPASVRKITQQPLRKYSIDDTPLENREDLDKAPINVLKVFTGNVNFNATFKSVSFERNTLATDLIFNALKKFRSNTDPNDYYLTVTPLQTNSELAAVGERRLLPNENINKVLDSYGVMSYLSGERRVKDGKKTMSRVNQADGTIKITLYAYDTPAVPIRICYDNGDGINQWEKMSLKEGVSLDQFLNQVVDAFGVSNEDGEYRLYSLSAKVIVEKENLSGLIDAAKEKGQVLTFRLILKSEAPSLSRNGSRLDPGRTRTLDPGRSSPAPTPPAKSLSVKINSDSTLTDIQPLGFDDLLSSLESSIMERSAASVTSATPKLQQTFESLEKDLEALISNQMRKTADQRRSGRLSMIKKQKEEAPEIDTEKLFLDLKESSNTLSRLEGNLNTMLDQYALVGEFPQQNHVDFTKGNSPFLIQIFLVDLGTVKTSQFPSDMYVLDVQKEIRAKFNYGEGGLDHGLLIKDLGIWLHPNKMLGHYDLKFGDTLEFKKKHRILKVKGLDGSIKSILVDETGSVKNVVDVICQKIGMWSRLRLGLANSEEYSLMREVSKEEPNKKEKKKGPVVVTDAQGWLNPEKTLREQGLTEEDFVVLKKKFFVTDQNVDRTDPVQLVIMYTQASEDILSGKIPCTAEEAAQFGGIAMQIKYGNQDPAKHKPGFAKMKELVPSEYHKNKDVEKAIYKEHSMLAGTTELNAKFRYVQLIRSLKSYGTSFFLVKEPGKKKSEPVLLGITKQAAIRLDPITKEVLSEWKLTHLRRWSATPKSFTLDLGDYDTKYYQVETTEGEEIVRLLSGYVEILVKKRNMLTTKPIEQTKEEQAVVEDYVKPGQSKNVAVVTTNSSAKVAKSIDRSKGEVVGSIAPIKGVIAEDLEVVENQENLLKKIRQGMDALEGYLRDMQVPVALQSIGADAAAVQWRQDTSILNTENLAAHVAGLLAAVCAMLLDANGDVQNMDYQQLEANLANIVIEAGEATQNLRVLTGLTQSDDDQEDLLAAGQSLVQTATNLLRELQPIVTGHRVLLDLHGAASKLAEAGSNIMILTDKVEISEENQGDLVNAAKDIGTALSNLVNYTRQVKAAVPSVETKKKLEASAVASSEASAALAAITGVMASVICDPLGRDQMIQTAIAVREKIDLLESYCAECPDADLARSLQQAIIEAEEALSYLIEKAKQPNNTLESEIQYYHDAILENGDEMTTKINNPSELFAAAKDMAINGTRLAEVLKAIVLDMNNEQQELSVNADAKLLGELMAKLVAATKGVIADQNNIDNKNKLLVVVNEVEDLTQKVCAPFVKTNLVQNLIRAFRNTITSSNHVVASGRQAAVSNRDRSKQNRLNKSGKAVVERIPKAIKAINEAKENPNDYVARFKLIEIAKEYLDPAKALVDSSDDALTTINEGLSKDNLLAATQRLFDELENFMKLLGLASEILEQTDFGTVIEAVKMNEIQVDDASSPVGLINAEAQIVDHSKAFGDAVKQITDAMQVGDVPTAKRLIAVTVSEFQAIKSISNRVETDSDNPSIKLDLLDSAQSVGDSLAAMIEAVTKNSDAKELKRYATQTTKNVNKMLHLLPRQKATSEAMETVKKLTSELEKRKKNSIAMSPTTPASAGFINEYVQGAMLTAANALSTAAVSLTAQKQADPNAVTNQIQNLEKAYGSLVEFSAQLPQTETGARVAQTIYQIGLETDYFLNILQSSLLDGETVTMNEELTGAAKLVSNKIDDLLGVFGSSNAALDDCAKALQTLSNAGQLIADINKPRNKQQNYTDIQYLGEGFFEELGSQCRDITTAIEAGDSPAIALNTRQLAYGLTDFIGISMNGAHILAAADPTSIPAIPGKLDQERALAVIKDLRLNLTKIHLNNATQSSLFSTALDISNETANLCNMCKACTTDDLISDSLRASLLTRAASLAQVSSNLIPTIKNLAIHRTEKNRDLCSPGSQQFLDELEKLERLVEMPVFLGQMAKPSTKALAIQSPIVANAKAAVVDARDMISSIQGLISDPSNLRTRDDVATSLSAITNSCSKILETLKKHTPADAEFAALLVGVKQSMSILDYNIKKAKNSEVIEEMIGDIITLKDTLKGVLDVADNVMVSRANTLSLLMNMEELTDRFDFAAKSAVSVAATSNPESQGSILQSVQDLASLLLDLVKLAKTDVADPSDVKAFQMHTKNSEIKRAVDNVNQKLSDAEKLDPLFSTNEKRIADFVAELDSKIKNLNEPYHAIGQAYNSTVLGMNKFPTVLTEALVNRNLDKYGDVAKQLADVFDQFGTELTHVIKQSKNDDAAFKLKKTMNEIGEIMIKSINGLKICTRNGQEQSGRAKVNQCLKDMTPKFLLVDALMLKALPAISACKQAHKDIEAVEAEIEVSLVFAGAKQLNPTSEGDTFAKHKNALVSSATKLSEVYETFAKSNLANQESLVTLVATSLTAIQDLKTRSIAAATSISSSDFTTQQELLKSANSIVDAMKTLIDTTLLAAGSQDSDEQMRDLHDTIFDQIKTVNTLLSIVKTLDAEQERNYTAFQNIIDAMRTSAFTLTNDEPALGTALPSEIVNLANQVTNSVTAMVAKANMKTDEMIPLLNHIKNDIDNICRAGKAAVVNAPKQNSLETVNAINSVSSKCISIVEKMQEAQESGNVEKLKQQLQVGVKEVASAVTVVVTAASKLVPAGYVDPNDPNVIAERELLSAANAIEAAARKLATLRPAEKPREANEELNFEEQILEAAKAIAAATSALVRSATGVQREIVAKGKAGEGGDHAMYFSDGTWSEGLVSAAKLVVGATSELCDSANSFVKNEGEMERVIVGARNVSASTVQLLTAAAVRSDPNSAVQIRLRSAGKAVTNATDQLVEASRNAKPVEQNESEGQSVSGGNAHQGKILEMEIQMKILKLEKELEQARAQLATIRKNRYTAVVAPTQEKSAPRVVTTSRFESKEPSAPIPTGVRAVREAINRRAGDKPSTAEGTKFSVSNLKSASAAKLKPFRPTSPVKK